MQGQACICNSLLPVSLPLGTVWAWWLLTRIAESNIFAAFYWEDLHGSVNEGRGEEWLANVDLPPIPEFILTFSLLVPEKEQISILFDSIFQLGALSLDCGFPLCTVYCFPHWFGWIEGNANQQTTVVLVLVMWQDKECKEYIHCCYSRVFIVNI